MKFHFNIMTFNIRMNTPDDGVNAWPLRKDKVIGLIKFHKTDIFGVQEAQIVLKKFTPSINSTTIKK